MWDRKQERWRGPRRRNQPQLQVGVPWELSPLSPGTLDWQLVTLLGSGRSPSSPSCAVTGPKPQAHVLTARDLMQARVTPWDTQALASPHSATKGPPCRVEGRFSESVGLACLEGAEAHTHLSFWVQSEARGTPASTGPSAQASTSGCHAGGAGARPTLANPSRPHIGHVMRWGGSGLWAQLLATPGGHNQGRLAFSAWPRDPPPPAQKQCWELETQRPWRTDLLTWKLWGRAAGAVPAWG